MTRMSHSSTMQILLKKKNNQYSQITYKKKKSPTKKKKKKLKSESSLRDGENRKLKNLIVFVILLHSGSVSLI